MTSQEKSAPKLTPPSPERADVQAANWLAAGCGLVAGAVALGIAELAA
ncbi:MAG: hypothetical protein QOI35_309, partial [Cryptosporangiaceae bacterium]|nr:hypothetical protein [Cryptosporangiaceae bacterium]